MNQHILITGATGMLGKELIQALLKQGDRVSILSRKHEQINQVNVFLWDVYKQEIDINCLNGVDSIIHLAGESIASEKWSEKRKKEIIDSRVLSAGLLFKTLAGHKNQVKHFISAAAVGIYGNRGDEILTEESPVGKDFLADCCVAWEKAVNQGEMLGLRVVKLRTGVVLSKNDGALPQMAKPIQLLVGAPLGTGKQWVPWVHYRDMTQIYLQALADQHMSGVYNACAPFPVTNKTITKAIAKQLHRPVWPFSIPEKVMKLILGEMSVIVLNSTNTSAQKLLDTGFIFKYIYVEDALADIYSV
ncbi:TIGR01777 family oxidoreductase [Pedobacter sp. L105]|uniref:TIGR01777 family oxidoreductase n=1 Tax=Pedobacter sp. L105 TaxID=1641871 RepID=UPI00131DF6B7|nr:TIGR01777 family oxidoreductase [Pedobacter sp. L105]